MVDVNPFLYLRTFKLGNITTTPDGRIQVGQGNASFSLNYDGYAELEHPSLNTVARDLCFGEGFEERALYLILRCFDLDTEEGSTIEVRSYVLRSTPEIIASLHDSCLDDTLQIHLIDPDRNHTDILTHEDKIGVFSCRTAHLFGLQNPPKEIFTMAVSTNPYGDAPPVMLYENTKFGQLSVALLQHYLKDGNNMNPTHQLLITNINQQDVNSFMETDTLHTFEDKIQTIEP
jgi:hypothetical protein